MGSRAKCTDSPLPCLRGVGVSQVIATDDFAAAARALAHENAMAWRAEAFDAHPRTIGGVVVRTSRWEKDANSADVITIETRLEQGGTESQPCWSLWAFDAPAGQEPARKTRLLSELALKVGEGVICTYGGLKPFSDGSGHAYHAFRFERVAMRDVAESDDVPPEPEFGPVPF
jgi:hypothetical protein